MTGLRLPFDVAVLVAVVWQLVRIRGVVTWAAFRNVTLGFVSLLVIYFITLPLRDAPVDLDLAYAAIACTALVVSGGRFERFASAEYRIDPSTSAPSRRSARWRWNAAGVASVLVYFLLAWLFTGSATG